MTARSLAPSGSAKWCSRASHVAPSQKLAWRTGACMCACVHVAVWSCGRGGKTTKAGARYTITNWRPVLTLFFAQCESRCLLRHVLFYRSIQSGRGDSMKARRECAQQLGTEILVIHPMTTKGVASCKVVRAGHQHTSSTLLIQHGNSNCSEFSDPCEGPRAVRCDVPRRSTLADGVACAPSREAAVPAKVGAPVACLPPAARLVARV